TKFIIVHICPKINKKSPILFKKVLIFGHVCVYNKEEMRDKLKGENKLCQENSKLLKKNRSL
ncbi:hypothetical protein, partial [Bacillus wiedmannii]|uniref:hypothetical protein n=1 Tax=Bacillus wiedmannii TaxID=1890302 RepID=UPI001C54D67D